MSIVAQFLLFAMDLVCAIELKNMVNKKGILCFRVPRGIIKGESCRCALCFRFSSTPATIGAQEGGVRGGEKERNENVTLDDARNRRLIGSSESQSARPDLTRPGIACCNPSIPKGWKRCQSVFLGRVRGPSQAIGYS